MFSHNCVVRLNYFTEINNFYYYYHQGPPAHLCGGHAGQDYPMPEEDGEREPSGVDRRDRQDGAGAPGEVEPYNVLFLCVFMLCHL